MNAAIRLNRTDEVSIVEALMDSYNGNIPSAFSKLARLSAQSARTASLFIVSNTETTSGCLDWIENAGLALSDFDPDGKFLVIKKQLDAGR